MDEFHVSLFYCSLLIVIVVCGLLLSPCREREARGTWNWELRLKKQIHRVWYVW